MFQLLRGQKPGGQLREAALEHAATHTVVSLRTLT